MSDPRPDSFAALFEGQSKQAPRVRTLRIGEALEAVVAKIGRDTVFLELDAKRQAFMEVAELRLPDGTLGVKVGDRITANVVEIDERTGNVRVGRSMGNPGSLAAIEHARDAGVAIEGKVTGANKGGLEIDLDGTRAFCPISQADVRFVQDPSTLVGRTLRFMVTEVREGGRSVVLSRKVVLEHEAREARAKLVREIQPGAVFRGTVTGVREFGAFVDLGGGLEGLVPASEISHDRSGGVGDYVAAGDTVDVQVREVKEVASQRPGDPGIKITLSMKALAADPWDSLGGAIVEGRVVSGRVARVTDFGAFVQLAPGVEGLLHVSELGGRAERLPKTGDVAHVVVRKLDRDAHKISLAPAPEGTSAGATIAPFQIAIGAIVNGVVDRIETYGVFVQVEGTAGRAGRGLIPNAELGVPRGTDIRKHFPEGTRVTAKVLETGDGRLRLSIRAQREDEERAQFDGYREQVSAPKKLGTLGDLLAKKRK